ncbi:unnamed protein product [Linum tenue]|uniref:Cation/H+ exchanger transmembrane domain-containing protein n=1 Tax=Linum tenue TaxID=586396 RepID=A0AAV0QSH6_9ROSI|nr:unnamed protein product [Linum tenue]
MAAMLLAKPALCGFWRCLLLLFLVVAAPTRICESARSDKEMRERFYGNLINNTTPDNGEGSIAQMFDRVLEKEFSENDKPEGSDGSNFNNSVNDQQAVLETVAKVTHEKGKKNDSQPGSETLFLGKLISGAFLSLIPTVISGPRSFQLQDVFSLENEDSEDTTLIDKKDNVFVMSNKKSKYPVLQVDLRLISDLVVVIVSAAIGGIIFSCLGQPIIVGYLLAGSIIGPGGLKFISEMVQVETFAQFGVIFLLFALGLEFSITKLRVVGAVAVFGGFLQIVIFMFLSGVTAMLCGAQLSVGVFVGSFLSMSSTAVDCAIGLLFALLPVLGGSSGLLHGMISMGKLLLVLSMFLTAASFLSWSFVPRFLKLMIQISSQTNELYQLAAVAFCLLSAWCSDKLGLSLELGSFVAGVMISTTDLAQHTLDQVGVLLAQIGEFAFVLLSRASTLNLVEVESRSPYRFVSLMSRELAIPDCDLFTVMQGKMYLLLLGTTALSLVTTPLLFKLIPNVMNLGVLLQWFPSESAPNEEKVSMIEAHNRLL